MCYMSWLECERRQSIEDGPLITELMQQVHCVAMALKTSMDSHKACYELKIPLAKNGSATATITMKPECLVCSCVEQDILYPWMWCTIVRLH